MNKGKPTPCLPFIPVSLQSPFHANPKIDSAKVLWVGMLRPVQPRSSPCSCPEAIFHEKPAKSQKRYAPLPTTKYNATNFRPRERQTSQNRKHIEHDSVRLVSPKHSSFIDKSGARRKRRFRGSRALNCACCDQSVFAYPFPVGRRGMGEEKWRGGCCLTTFYS